MESILSSSNHLILDHTISYCSTKNLCSVINTDSILHRLVSFDRCRLLNSQWLSTIQLWRFVQGWYCWIFVPFLLFRRYHMYVVNCIYWVINIASSFYECHTIKEIPVWHVHITNSWSTTFGSFLPHMPLLKIVTKLCHCCFISSLVNLLSKSSTHLSRRTSRNSRSRYSKNLSIF